MADIRPITKEEIFQSAWVVPQIPLKLIPSAGTSGKRISFRFTNPERDARVLRSLLQFTFDDLGLDIPKTFFLNCYPLGVQLPERSYSVDVATRVDILKQLLPQMGPQFETFIVVAQPHFAKHLMDSQVLALLRGRKIAVILGGGWYPKTFDDYLRSQILTSGNEPISVISFLGTAETGLGIGYMGQQEVAERAALGTIDAPMIFQPNREEYWLEVIEGELAVTVLDPTCRPLLYRYLTNDKAVLLDNQKLGLKGFSEQLVVERILARFYESRTLPGVMTGAFFIRRPEVFFCGKEGQSDRQMLEAFGESGLSEFLKDHDLKLRVCSYQEYPFMQPLEKKPRYL